MTTFLLRTRMLLVLCLAWVGTASSQPADGRVDMNFEQVDIGQLVKIVSEATGERFVVSDAIAGQKVTSRADALRIAQTLDPDTLVPVVIDRRGVLYTYRVDARDPRTKRAFRYFDTTD